MTLSMVNIFLYDDNMAKYNLELIVGEVERICEYELRGYELTFGVMFNSMPRVNLVRGDENACVQGVIYRLTLHQANLLNKEYGLPYVYDKQLRVDNTGRVFGVYICESNLFYTKEPPLMWYVFRIVRAAQRNGFVETARYLKNYLLLLFNDRKNKRKHEQAIK